MSLSSCPARESVCAGFAISIGPGDCATPTFRTV
jgi:hypothetical protein